MFCSKWNVASAGRAHMPQKLPHSAIAEWWAISMHGCWLVCFGFGCWSSSMSFSFPCVVLSIQHQLDLSQAFCYWCDISGVYQANTYFIVKNTAICYDSRRSSSDAPRQLTSSRRRSICREPCQIVGPLYKLSCKGIHKSDAEVAAFEHRLSQPAYYLECVEIRC